MTGMCVAIADLHSPKQIFSPNVFEKFTSLSTQTIQKIKNVAIGVLAVIIELPILTFVYHKVIDLMKSLACDVSKPQDIVAVFNFTNKIKYTFIAMAFKAALIGFIVIGGPIIEERLFRDKLHNIMRNWVHNPDSLKGKIIRVGGNGLIFGACHLSPFQGWANIPIFLVTFLLGCLFTALRESTGDLTACTTAHILHNGVTMIAFLCGG